MQVLLTGDDDVALRQVAAVVEAGGHTPLRQTLAADSPIESALILLAGRDACRPESLMQLRRRCAPRSKLIALLPRTAAATLPALIDAGVNDFTLLPASGAEIAARLDLWLRREASLSTSELQAGPYYFNAHVREVRLHQKALPTTDKEFDVAFRLFRSLGEIVSREELMRTVWGRPVGASRTIDTHICRLRRKLQLTARTGYRLVSVYGAGYRVDLDGHPDAT
jgi:DNA-binding response OmpR family regulator